jgi:hypothetical protein
VTVTSSWVIIADPLNKNSSFAASELQDFTAASLGLA